MRSPTEKSGDGYDHVPSVDPPNHGAPVVPSSVVSLPCPDTLTFTWEVGMANVDEHIEPRGQRRETCLFLLTTLILFLTLEECTRLLHGFCLRSSSMPPPEDIYIQGDERMANWWR